MNHDPEMMSVATNLGFSDTIDSLNDKNVWIANIGASVDSI